MYHLPGYGLVTAVQGRVEVHHILSVQGPSPKGSSHNPHGLSGWQHATARSSSSAAPVRGYPCQAPRRQHAGKMSTGEPVATDSGMGNSKGAGGRSPATGPSTATHRGDTPFLISPNARLLNDQDENAQWSLSLSYSGAHRRRQWHVCEPIRCLWTIVFPLHLPPTSVHVHNVNAQL